MFYKIHTLTCGGIPGAQCNYKVEATRRDLPKAVRDMQAHCDDRKHKLVLDKWARTSRVVNGTPD